MVVLYHHKTVEYGLFFRQLPSTASVDLVEIKRVIGLVRSQE
jgi:hypothetical protein